MIFFEIFQVIIIISPINKFDYKDHKDFRPLIIMIELYGLQLILID